MGAPNVINDAYRRYDDDVAGGITAQTPLNAVDTDWSQTAAVKFHVAMLVTENNNGNANNYTYRLEYNLGGAGWNDVTTSTPIQAVTADNCNTSTSASYGTTALTTGATIQATEYNNNGSDGNAVTLKNSSFELTTCLQIDSAQVTNGDTIQLRLTNAGVALVDTTIPTITVIDDATAARQLKRYNGSSWVGVPIKRYNGSSWVEVQLKRYNGATWDTLSG